MRGNKICAILLMALFVASTLFFVSVTEIRGDPVYKQIVGIVDQNPVTLVRAYDPNPALNGFVYFYIQNRTNEGNGTDPMTTLATWDVYDPEIYLNLSDWQIGDEVILIVEREYGSYGTDHAGYIAFTNVTLDDVVGAQTAPTTELQKIPAPTFVSNGTGYIEITWAPLIDPNGLMAGYKVYRSTTNGTVLGDDDWELVGGSVSAPLTATNFNDTSVGGDIYYYSIKVVFTGYKNNDPLQIDNYQNEYFGEGSAPMSAPVTTLTVDYFNLTTGTGPDGPLLVNEILDVGKQVTIWASGYNRSTSPHTYVPLPVIVDWSQSISLGSFSTLTGWSTIFTAGYYQGGTTITGQTSAFPPPDDVDTGDITVNPPKVDYILLTDSANGTEIPDMPRNTNDPLDIYASGYNKTADTYVKLVEVDWTETAIPPLGNFVPIKGTSSTYTGTSGGLTTIKGENTSMTPTVSDTFQLTLIAPPEIDDIKITFDPNGVTIPDNLNLAVGDNITVYASGYNISTGLYVNLVNVDWTLTPIGDLGYIDNITGTSTKFFANLTGGGPINLLGTSVTNPNLKDEFNITILNPTVDYILIRSGDMGGGKNLSDPANYPTYPLNYSTILYGWEYNNTAGPIGPVSDTSTWVSDATTIATVTSPGNRTTVKCNETNSGVATITLNDGVRQTTTQITVMQVTVDYIQIRDESGGGGNVLSNPSYPVGATDIFYGARYNQTVGYIGDVPVTSTWVSTDNSIVSVVSPGGQTTITCSDTNPGTITITLTDLDSGKSNTTQVTVLDPTIDYILIVDTSGTGASEIANQTVDVGVTITGYAASFNNTALYLGDIQVTWSVTNEDLATASTDPELNSITSDFDSGNHEGTATWTADDGSGHTDVVVFTINPPVIDYIRIETETGGAGEEVDTATFRIGETDQYYCAGYNNSVGYIEDKSAAWSVDVVIGTFDPTPGTFTLFEATTAGEGIITATFGSLTDSTGTITVYPNPPSAPTGLQVSQVAAGEALDLAWNANPESFDIVYNIWRSPSGASGTYTEIATYVSDTSYTDTGLTNGNTYYYQIIAVGVFPAPNASGPSEAANNVCDADTDGDGTFNLQDDDDDGDGLLDTEEDKNGNGIKDDDETDPLLSDTDGDGHNDLEDEYPLDPDKWKKEEEEFPVMLVLIPIIIIIIVLILLMLLLKKRKPAEIPAVPEEERELPPPPGAPVEEEEGALPEEEELPPEEEAPPEGEEVISEEEMPPEEEIPESEKETPP
jgi:hypothetical protein